MTDWLLSADRSFFLFLNSFHASWLDPMMQILSGQLIWVPFIGYFFYLGHRQFGSKGVVFFGLFLLLSLIASDVTSSYIIKNIFNRLRPCREVDLKPLIYTFGQKCGGKFGFVSSHAANSIALIFFSLRALRPTKKFFFIFWIGPLLVSYSRIYLGVHYPGDILGGILVGLFWGGVFSSLFHLAQGARR